MDTADSEGNLPDLAEETDHDLQVDKPLSELGLNAVANEEGDFSLNDEVDDDRSSATPTQDDNISPIEGESGIMSHQPPQFRLTDGLVSSLSAPLNEIPLPVIEESADHQIQSTEHQKSESLVDPDAIDDVSDGDLEDESGGDGFRNKAKDSRPSSAGEGRFSSLSPVSNSSLPVANDNNRKDDDEISSLSDFTSYSSERVVHRSDLEDGEILNKTGVPGPDKKKRRRRASERSPASRRSNILSRSSRNSSRSEIRDNGSTDRKKKKRKPKRNRSGTKKRRHDSSGLDLDDSPRHNAPSTRNRHKTRREIPRYDVRNLILKKRMQRQRGSLSDSRSRSRSRSRPHSRSWSRSRNSRSRSRDRSRNRSRLRSFSRSRSRSRHISRERKRSYRKRSLSGDRRSHGRRSRSRNRSRSRSFSPRRHSLSPGRRSKKRKDKSKKRWPRRSRSRSRSPSVILDEEIAPKKTHRTRGTSPKKKRKDGRVSKKVTKLSKKSGVGVTTKKNKNKKSKRIDDDVIVEKTVNTGKTKKKKNRRLNVVGGSLVDNFDDDLSLINTHVSSDIANKEVFTSGDKIMVSVNFRSNNRNVATGSVSPKRGATSTVDVTNAKPMCVIDVMSSPYRIIEGSPKEVVDVLSDDDETKKKSSVSNNNNVNAKAQQKVNKPRTSPPVSETRKSPSPKDSPDKQQQPPPKPQIEIQYDTNEIVIHTGHKGPCTPPPTEEMMINLTRGPQTPSEPMDDSYDPCNPTESPEMSWENQSGHRETERTQSADQSSNRSEQAITTNGSTLNNANSGRDDQFSSLLSTAAKAIPFLFENVLGSVAANGGSAAQTTDNGHHDDIDFDFDVGSPTSPKSSELSDIFEPPLDTPMTNKKVTRNMKRLHKAEAAKASQKRGAKASAGKLVHMKVVDDKLRIIDDVPSSAVEMAVKEKFLKKVQRQERAVEEIKLVLKPHYHRKKIDKDTYKEILRKCVPKVCHSKNGDINPMKIEKLVAGYIKKYAYLRKKGSQRSF